MEEGENKVLLNGREAGIGAKVHDGDKIERKPKPLPKPEEKEEKEEPKDTLEEQMEKDPLLQPTKPLPDWMKEIPFDTAKLGADGKVIPGVMENRPVVDAVAPQSEAPAKAIVVKINGDKYTMPKKAKPIFVDVFDVFPFDMSKAGGTRLITRINGVDKDFTEPLNEGDEIDIYWEK